MAKAGPGLLVMQGAACFVPSIVMEMHIHTCSTTPISKSASENQPAKK